MNININREAAKALLRRLNEAAPPRPPLTPSGYAAGGIVVSPNTERAQLPEGMGPVSKRGQELRAVAAHTLRAFADSVERELVCCDAYDGKGSAGKHGICYWGGAVAFGARKDADEIEQGTGELLAEILRSHRA